jgi:hypothetical protein
MKVHHATSKKPAACHPNRNCAGQLTVMHVKKPCSSSMHSPCFVLSSRFGLTFSGRDFPIRPCVPLLLPCQPQPTHILGKSDTPSYGATASHTMYRPTEALAPRGFSYQLASITLSRCHSRQRFQCATQQPQGMPNTRTLEWSCGAGSHCVLQPSWQQEVVFANFLQQRRTAGAHAASAL